MSGCILPQMVASIQAVLVFFCLSLIIHCRKGFKSVAQSSLCGTRRGGFVGPPQQERPIAPQGLPRTLSLGLSHLTPHPQSCRQSFTWLPFTITLLIQSSCSCSPHWPTCPTLLQEPEVPKTWPLLNTGYAGTAGLGNTRNIAQITLSCQASGTQPSSST